MFSVSFRKKSQCSMMKNTCHRIKSLQWINVLKLYAIDNFLFNSNFNYVVALTEMIYQALNHFMKSLPFPLSLGFFHFYVDWCINIVWHRRQSYVTFSDLFGMYHFRCFVDIISVASNINWSRWVRLIEKPAVNVRKYVWIYACSIILLINECKVIGIEVY